VFVVDDDEDGVEEVEEEKVVVANTAMKTRALMATNLVDAFHDFSW
jgi:hypothetical protein